jgi:hypothetical protein
MAQKDSYDFEAKTEYRRAWGDFITKRHSKEKERKSLRVACLPGPEALEITEVYDKLGVPRHKIWGIEKYPGPAKQLRDHNLGIQIYEGDVGDFFQGKPDVSGRTVPKDERFDVVNLDFQGQFKAEDGFIISDIFHKGHYKPHMILGTNFYGSREQKHMQDNCIRAVQSHSGRGLLDFAEGINPDVARELTGDLHAVLNRRLMLPFKDIDELDDDARDKSYCMRLRYLTSGNDVSEAVEGFLEHPELARASFHLNGIEYPVRDVPKLFQTDSEKAVAACRFLDSLRASRILELVTNRFLMENAQADCVHHHIGASILKRPFYITDFAKGRYVSDNGAPMFFDFLGLALQDHIVSKYEVDLRKLKMLGSGGGYIVVRQKNLKKDPEFYTLGDTAVRFGPLTNQEKLEDKILELLLEPNVEGIDKRFNLFFYGNLDDYTNDLLALQKVGMKEMDYVYSERPQIHTKTLGDKVRGDLTAGLPEKEVMEKYELTTRQLGAHKATISRAVNAANGNAGNGNGHENGNGHSNGNGNNGNGHNGKKGPSISEEDLAQVGELLYEVDVNGNYVHSSTEIAGLFEGKYTWQAFAGLRASKTREEGVSRSNCNVHSNLYQPTAGEEEEIRTYLQDPDIRDDEILAAIPITKMQLAARKAGLKREENQVNGNGNIRGIRDSILERDAHTCQYPGCGRTDEQNKQESGHSLHVHHIDYNHDNRNPRNQVALCTSHHAMTNTVQHAGEMRITLEEIVAEKYSGQIVEVEVA